MDLLVAADRSGGLRLGPGAAQVGEPVRRRHRRRQRRRAADRRPGGAQRHPRRHHRPRPHPALQTTNGSSLFYQPLRKKNSLN